MACRLATCPTNRSPVLVNPTTDGVVRPPSSLGITFGSPPSITATTEFVVPKSMPIIFAIASLLPHARNSCWFVDLDSHLSLSLSSYLMLGFTLWIQAPHFYCQQSNSLLVPEAGCPISPLFPVR